MSISHRLSIRWLPSPATEPTSTLVLTSPLRSFVDVRILLPIPSTSSPSPPSTLDWALAGTSSSTPISPGVTRGVWRHHIDSRTPDAEGVADEGINHERDDGTVFETGRMVNSETGEMGDYEEVWRDEDVKPVGGGGAGARCVVLKLEEDGVKGSVVLLGRYCQGIVRLGDSVSVERWQWQEGGDGVRDAWTKVYMMGERGHLPCEELVDWQSAMPFPPDVGDELKTSKWVWVVTEGCDV